MSGYLFPARNQLTICFAHVAYRLADTFDHRATGIHHFQVWSTAELNARIAQADVLVISGFWHNELLDLTSKLQYIQSIGAGYDQFPLADLKRRGIRLANARGVNRNAVGEHAMGMILAFARHLHTGRDNQRRHHWRGMISDLARREDEMGGKTILIIGLGGLGRDWQDWQRRLACVCWLPSVTRRRRLVLPTRCTHRIGSWN